MECQQCGSDNQEDSRFCRRCGTALSQAQVTSTAQYEMSNDAQEETNEVDISGDAVVVLQSRWSYMLYTIPWLILFGVSFTFDILTFGVLPTVLAIYIVGSRFVSYRRTAYILTETDIVVFQGSLLGRRRIDLSLANLNNVLFEHGMFGRSLGYTRVSLQLKDGRIVLLHYVPLAPPLLEHLWERVNP